MTVTLNDIVPQIAFSLQSTESQLDQIPSFSQSVERDTRKENARVKFFPRGVLMHHKRRTKPVKKGATRGLNRHKNTSAIKRK